MVPRSVILAATLLCLWSCPSPASSQQSEETRATSSAEADSSSSWTIVVSADGTLYWYGHRFSGTVEFRFSQGRLLISGVPVPAWLPSFPPNPESYPHGKVDMEAGRAATFEEFVDVYRGSPLVKQLTVGTDEIIVDWVDDGRMGPIVILWRPGDRGVPRPSPVQMLREQVDGVAGYLAHGYNVWSHDGKLYAAKPGTPTELPSWALEDLAHPVEPTLPDSGGVKKQ